MAFVREEVTGDDLMVPLVLNLMTFFLCCLIKQMLCQKAALPFLSGL